MVSGPYSRKEVIGDCTLYLGDSRGILLTLDPVDAVVTDPPFGIQGGKGGDARDFKKGDYSGEWLDDESYVSMCAEWIAPYLDGSIPAAVTPGNRCIWLYPRPRDVGCFWQPASCTHGPWGMVTFNPILFYGPDWRAGKGALPSGKTVTEAPEKNGHPCPKPEKAWTWLVDKVAPSQSLVLDPFMGSGTTGVACAKMDRRFIGIEIDEAYFDIACQRIDDAYRQGKLFSESA